MRPLQQGEKVAIAIPTRNRWSYLAVLLGSLIHQTYENWMLVINDSSVPAIEDNDTIRDVLTVIRTMGHEVRIIHTDTGWDRHQRALEAVPESIEVILRIDDDLMPTPEFLEDLLKPFYFFPDRPIAAVGGCTPETHRKPIDLDFRLTYPDLLPTVDEPTWRLQGYRYTDAYVLEVESLLGHAICYRRSAIAAVGGWAVQGYSQHAFREETDLCMRLRAEGYPLLVTTQALAWHLYSPSGGSRTVRKTDQGVFLVDEDIPLLQPPDEVLFRRRLDELKTKKGLTDQVLKRYRLRDLEEDRVRPMLMITWAGRIKRKPRQVVHHLRALKNKIRQPFR